MFKRALFPFLVKLLERGEERLVLAEFGRGGDLGGGGEALGDDIAEGIVGGGGVPDDEAEFTGFLEGKDREVAGAEQGGLLVDQQELGVDHGIGEVDGDTGAGGNLMQEIKGLSL